MVMVKLVATASADCWSVHSMVGTERECGSLSDPGRIPRVAFDNRRWFRRGIIDQESVRICDPGRKFRVVSALR